MSEGPLKSTRTYTFAEAAKVDSLASQALTVVASRSPHNAAKVYHELVLQLADGVRSMEMGAPDDAVATLRDHGCTTEDISDIYIPAAARLLGDEWCRDEVSFADVTIGVARLQAMLRGFEQEWFAKSGRADELHSALLIVCQDDFHTLGAMVVAGQLRRMGVSVRLSIGQTHSERMGLIEDNSFDMVMISASRTENLETTRKLVKNIRTASRGRLKIVLGGSVIEQKVNVKALTGADYVENDPKEALRLCGLKTHHQGAGLSEIRS